MGKVVVARIRYKITDELIGVGLRHCATLVASFDELPDAVSGDPPHQIQAHLTR